MVCRWPRVKPPSHKIFPVFFALGFGGFVASHSSYADSTGTRSSQIEYIAPDGQFSSLNAARSTLQKPGATFIDRDTISCVLREGETTFIIQLPKDSPPDRFTFLNENAAACGELRIAVSNSPLPADSPKWIEVDGIVPFAHKRLFKLSILGVETKFIRLSFKVDGKHRESARISDPFATSFLAARIDSNFSGARKDDLDLNFATSVGALWARQN